MDEDTANLFDHQHNRLGGMYGENRNRGQNLSALNYDIFQDTTFLADGKAIVLHGKPSDINIALKRLSYSWNPWELSSIDNVNHPRFDNTMTINAYGMHAQFVTGSRRIHVMGTR